MRTCVIFNPTAKGQKAEKLRAQLETIASRAALKQTTAAGDARRLATQAIAEGCTTIIAAGGDGTVNEVLNGIGDAQAFDRVRLGVLPLGTVNVFAKELKIPSHPAQAWQLILRGRYTRIDLGWVEFSIEAKPQRQYFMQLAGAGLDARAVQLVDWRQKKKVGPLAYVMAGLKALREPQPRLTVMAGSTTLTGELALIGNGRFYGGRMEILQGANLRDGLLDVVVFPRVRGLSAVGLGLHALVFRRLPREGLLRARAAKLIITATPGAGFELDGEYAGQLPATFGVDKERLRVIVP